MKRVPLLKVGQGLIAIVSAGTGFSTPLQRCQLGSRAALPKIAAELQGCLPAVVATPGDAEMDRNDQISHYLEQGIPYDLNLLVPIPETGEDEANFALDQECLAELFTDLDSFELPDEPNVEVEDVICRGVYQQDWEDLEDPLPIAWVRVRVLVKLNSWS